MLGWAIGFFIAALIAAVFGFGGFATAFAGVAIILFWVFLALFALSLLFGKFGGASAAGHGASGGLFATLALVGGVALLVYAWMDNDMSAERVGASIDRHAAQWAENTSDAFSRAGERAEDLTQETSTELRRDAAGGLDEASDTVAPEEEDDRAN
jgi:uncharacterized membrane protein YtjA (UPF0391 family)